MKIEHGFNLSVIRRELDGETWEQDDDNTDIDVRRVYLGTVFSLTPSGKFYMPFACSNVTPCEHCHGHGIFPAHRSRRVAKRRASRAARIRARYEARLCDGHGVSDAGRLWLARHRNTWQGATGPSCTYCGGLGSREAHYDEIWQVLAEKAIGSIASNHHGVFLEWSDGDAFAVECREHEESESEFDERSHYLTEC